MRKKLRSGTASSAMAEYRFCLLGHEREPETSCLIEADTDDEACTIGKELLGDTAFTHIQVWCKDRLVLYTNTSHLGEWAR